MSSQGGGGGNSLLGEASLIMFNQQNESKIRDAFAGKVPQSNTDGFFGHLQDRATRLSPENAGIFQAIPQPKPKAAAEKKAPAQPKGSIVTSRPSGTGRPSSTGKRTRVLDEIEDSATNSKKTKLGGN
jgi:hypothetical protein